MSAKAGCNQNIYIYIYLSILNFGKCKQPVQCYIAVPPVSSARDIYLWSFPPHWRYENDFLGNSTTFASPICSCSNQSEAAAWRDRVTGRDTFHLIKPFRTSVVIGGCRCYNISP